MPLPLSRQPRTAALPPARLKDDSTSTCVSSSHVGAGLQQANLAACNMPFAISYTGNTKHVQTMCCKSFKSSVDAVAVQQLAGTIGDRHANAGRDACCLGILHKRFSIISNSCLVLAVQVLERVVGSSQQH